MSKSTSSVMNSTTDTNDEEIDPSSVEHNSLVNPQPLKMLYAHLRSDCILLVAAVRLTNFHFRT